MKYVIFRLEDKDFALEIERVIEITRPAKVFSMPELPKFLEGIINLRGVIIPLIDLRKRLELDSFLQGKIIIIRYGGDRLGLRVDSVEEIIDIEEDEISEVPSYFKGFRTEYLKSFAKKEDRVIIILNLENILTSEERLSLKDAIKEYDKVME